jgi:hypothetical protein
MKLLRRRMLSLQAMWKKWMRPVWESLSHQSRSLFEIRGRLILRGKDFHPD